ncbi:unnamed protein product [Jaminaea pallidilutea]
METTNVLCLWAGGTIAMLRSESGGYAPYPGFLTETLRTQARFHDPDSSSIFSWSDSRQRFAEWSQAKSRPHSRSQSPAASPGVSREPSRAATPSSPVPTPGPSSLAGGPPFSKPMRVRSSGAKGTSTRDAVSKEILPDGSLDMQLPSLITPKSSHNQKRVRYTVLEYDPLLDSSEMGLGDWTRMAKDIQLNYADYDAFIILHGTDTMSYTASALSFLLENLGKTVIVTGAQVPLSELRNDAIENVLGALMIASSYIIPEVCLFFASTLYRGNRSSKVSNNALSAFDSPNMAPLARVGIGIDVAWNLVERPRTLRSFRAHDGMCPDVALLRLFPGMPTETIKRFLSTDIKGLCIESFGAGNAPSRPDLLEAFREATERGVVIVNITQCLQGEVSAIYALGQKLAAVGVVAGADMTPECAMTKLAYLLAKPELSRQQVREFMGRSLRGELTMRGASATTTTTKEGFAHKMDIGDLLARILQRPTFDDDGGSASEQRKQHDSVAASSASPEEGKAMERDVVNAERALLPFLIHRAAASGDVAALHWHLAALSRLESAPSIEVTSPAASANAAIPGSTESRISGVTAATASATAGASSSAASQTSPLDSSMALHIASTNGHAPCVTLLLEAGSSVHLREPYSGRTPLWLAAAHGHRAVVQILRSAGALLSGEEKEEAGEMAQRSNGAGSGSGSGSGSGGSGVESIKGENSEAQRSRVIWEEAGLEVVSDKQRGRASA